jgi:RNA polymerase sigma-70 factor, ECF subfamily
VIHETFSPHLAQPVDTLLIESNFKTIDQALLTKVLEGSERALEILFEFHSSTVYHAALVILSDPASAGDVVQAVFMQIWREPQHYIEMNGECSSWIAVAARDLATDMIRTNAGKGTA